MAWPLIWIFMSTLLQDVDGAPHRFLRQPYHTTVRVGETALLRCAIENKQTRVQWTRDGFGLGTTLFDTRMSFAGQKTLGEYNLQIRDVKLSDDGIYSCQAGPDYILGLRPLKSRDAKLNVIVPPKEVNIEPEASGAIDVKFPRQVTVTCTVPDTKPASKITWRVGGVDYEGAARRKVSAGSESKLVTTSSSIVLEPTKEENGTSVECVVSHSAMDAPVSRIATLNVLYPPNSPRISEFQAKPMQSGEELRVNCVATSGNPLARITWLIGDEVIQTDHHRTGRSTQSVLRHVLRPSDNGKVLVCRAESPALDEPLEDQVKLEVYYPPENIIIESEPEDGTQENGVMTFTCHYSDSNPRASLAWYIGDVKLSLQWSGEVASIPYHIRTLHSDDSAGGIELTLTSVRRQDADLAIKCKATIPEIGFTTEVITHPEINFAPRNVEVSVISPVTAPVTICPNDDEIGDAGIDRQLAYKAGDIVLFQCVAKGGNPPPDLIWSINGRAVVTDENTAISAPMVKVETAESNNDGETLYGEFITTRTMEITLRESHNNAVISCIAGHSGYSETVTDVATLKVAFPPKTLSVKQFPSSLVAGSQMSLTCITSSSFPLAKISWYKGDVKLPKSNYVTLSPNEGISGGLVASSRLHIVTSTDDNGASFTCRAEIEALQETITQSYKLRVEYPPVFYPVNGNNTSYNATEGDSFIEIEVVARANPYEVTYSWFRIVPMRNVDGDMVLTKNSLTKDRRFIWNGDKGILRINQVNRDDGGIYMVRATNSRGTTDCNITLNIFYPPVVTSVSGPNHALKEGESTELRCDFRSHPLAPPKVTWIKESPGSGRVNYNAQTFSDHSILVLNNLRASDRGSYKCLVDNGTGNGDFRLITLQLKHTPIFSETTPRKVAVSSVGNDGRLYPNAVLPCTVHSTPSAMITWSKDNDTINAAEDDRYSVLREVVDFETMRSSLRVNKISVEDGSDKDGALAEFVCKASNAQGESWKKIQIVLHGPPDAPSELKVHNVSATSVFLTWKKGFDGGVRQRFVVQYKQSADGTFDGDVEEITSHTNSRTIPNLDQNRKYVFRVVAKNDYGQSAQSEVLAARTESSLKKGSASAFGVKQGYIIAISVVFVIVVIVSIVVAVFTFRRCKISKQTYKPRTIETDCESLTHAESSLSSRCSSRKRDENEKLMDTCPSDTLVGECDLESNGNGLLIRDDNEVINIPLGTYEPGQSCYFDCSASRCSSHHSADPPDDTGCDRNTCAFSSFKSGLQKTAGPPSLDRLTFGSRSARTTRSQMDEERIARNCSEPRFRFDVVPTDDCFANLGDSASNRHLDLPLPPALPPYEHRGYANRPSAGSNCDIRSASSYAGARDTKENTGRSNFRQYRTLEPTKFNFDLDRFDGNFREDRTSFSRSNSMKHSSANSTGGCLYNLVSRPQDNQCYTDVLPNEDYATDANETRVRGSRSSSSSGGSGLYVRSMDNMMNHPETAPKRANIVNVDGSINTFGLDFPPPPLDIIRESQSQDPLQTGPDSQDFLSRRPSAFTSTSTANDRYGRKSSLKGINSTLQSKRAPTPSVRFRDELSKALNNPRPHDMPLPNREDHGEHSDDDTDSGCGGSADVAVHSDRSSVSPNDPRNSAHSPVLSETSGIVLRV